MDAVCDRFSGLARALGVLSNESADDGVVVPPLGCFAGVSFPVSAHALLVVPLAVTNPLDLAAALRAAAPKEAPALEVNSAREGPGGDTRPRS
jgi:hypothetical protein